MNIVVDGENIQTEKTFPVYNPINQEWLASVPDAGEDEAKRAVEAAHRAFHNWKHTTADERSVFLQRWFQLIEDHTDELAEVMTREQGKPLKEARGEIGYANSYISWFAEEAKRIYGQTIPASKPDKRILIQKQPVGVVAAITPWNFPAAMITRKVAPAIAAGCTVLIKPAEQTPLTALRLVELAHEAGAPPGLINILTGDAETISNVWMSDSRVTKLSFTGSTEVGKLLMKKSADTMKRISLELGGQAPFIVLPDADLDKAVAGAIASKFRNAGQTCICSNRFFVHESIVDTFTEKLKAAVEALKVGDGMDPETDIGPLIDQGAYEKVIKHMEDAVDNGAEIVTGGAGDPSEGSFFIQPTILKNVTDSMLCMNEETFGPLVPIASFSDESSAIERANDTPFGLAAYLFTENISKALTLSEKLDYGIVGLNDGSPSAAQAPFGGFKESGMGREGGPQGIEEYLETKYISLGV
ncbi:succinate-semialdehyde dehydrogenase / glutarate-semialdehyde dehydrogenase [Halobacillus karajensis]|uniref:Aldehyde dehydrogenase n=1 Tax=Halobacillus karajensis TaxID=195088 RepID=A0A059NWP1_9BACI|nr:NAD-dependent succinate-semialdehyde dehydrogenase [Halobacillus karajensis]CDQ18975.1 Succinate-semialdehyde dehydrogenase [NADP(+)] [Halobacillus karajensis]CDQ22951.1 Succinate-semialdehyde dehydrogenase [NADP(+)] [Halobacillus karajensis]CDQ26434.1 Succinate-semialdehyde dehydrogenase [NADP(+)] [Halobacillus karajensis]SEH43658.1 succinate-semialdehyde dehydrogenase / glutarate-semialdehyde dehydrogenase [Halobacillus karajensis]